MSSNNGFWNPMEVQGHRIVKMPFRCVNKRILQQIIEDSFKTKLADDYFPLLIEKDAVTYLELQYGGVANVLPHPSSGVPPHLKTLAVIGENQHKGTGKSLMYAVLEDYAKLNWLSKPDRDANDLYKKIAGKGKPFSNCEGITYLSYFVNHSRMEKRAALGYMKMQPDSFISENPEPQPLLTS